MEATSLPINRNQAFSDGLTPRIRKGNDRDKSGNKTSLREAGENRSSASVPKGLESMLKTTTETGDIGMFSIKPSRVPHGHTILRMAPERHSGVSRKSQQTFQPYGVPSIDDRRRLPSYARDANSEIVSMYETASQKSTSRARSDPDNRFYSMTQTSYSPYTLSNHRSYASLRSQPERGGFLQRPRSPFAYPARLRRPGLRPSSPALTDGGLIDYRRRAEIDRISNGFGHSSSSPASLYAQKRKPPLSLRVDGNRSTPSLLSQPSPPRRSCSPYLPSGNESTRIEGFRRNDITFLNTSPERTTFSSASIVNSYPKIAVPSINSTSGGLVSSSPLYYDYTEDFESEDSNPQEALRPSARFHTNKSTTEEKPRDQEQSILCRKFSDNGFDKPSHTFSYDDKPAKISSSPKFRDIETFGSARDLDEKETITGVSGLSLPHEKQVIQLPGLGCGAQELSDHVEEVFGLLPSSTYEALIGQNGIQVKAETPTRDQPVTNPEISLYGTPSGCPAIKLRHSLVTVSTIVGNVSPTSEAVVPATSTDGSAFIVTDQTAENRESKPNEHIFHASLISGSSRRTCVCSSESTSAEAGLDELTDLIRNVNDPTIYGTETQGSGVLLLGRNPMNPSTVPDGVVFRRDSSSDRSRGQANAREEKPETRVLMGRHHTIKDRIFKLSSMPGDGPNEIPRFSLQMPRRLISHSEPPMLAPKPISPTRQLRLKNSIPQLMKSLPSLPVEPLVRAFHPPSNKSQLEVDLPCCFSPLQLETRNINVGGPSETNKSLVIQAEKSISPVSLITVRPPIILNSRRLEAEAPISYGNVSLPPKLKLKMKPSTSLRSISPHNSRPWNCDENYPWSKEEPGICLPMSSIDRLTHKSPKFKLKVNRATDSTQGTVRINRASIESNALNFSNTLDLFTPSGFDSIIRHVSRHLHSRKLSTTSNSGNGALSSNLYHPVEMSDTQYNTFEVSISSMPPNQVGISETRSVFSDDSSDTQEQQGLQKRFPNPKAQIVVPYASKFGSQSLDDITWRDRNIPQTPKSPATRSIPNLRGSKSSIEIETTPARRIGGLRQGHRLATKMRAWIQGARSRITARIRGRRQAKEAKTAST